MPWTEIGHLALYKNDDSTPDNRKPLYSGPGKMTDGRDVRGACWIKTDKNGNKFLSVNVTVDEQTATPAQEEGTPDEEIPF